MKQKIEIPKGLKKVKCIKSDKDLFIENHPRLDVNEYFKDKSDFYGNRFTLGKIYNCHIDKSGKALVVLDDNGDYNRASYCYFEPVKKPLKKIIAAKLIKLLKKV